MNMRDFYINLEFTVYDGTERTLPRDDNMSVFVLMYDSHNIHQYTTKKQYNKMYWADDDVIIRISIGDAWVVVPTRKNVKFYIMDGN